MFHLRYLPAIIFVAALLLSMKIGDIWRGVDSAPGLGVAESQAQQTGAEPAPAAKEEKEKTGAKRKGLPEASSFGGTAADLAKQLEAGEPDEAEKKKEPGPPKDPTLFTQSEIELLQSLAERRDEIETREAEIDMREGLLRAAETRLDKKIAELKELKASIEALLKQQSEEEEAKLQRLVKIYEKMKPKDAARIFQELDMPILLDVVERMREAKTAPIFAEMDPIKAKTVTAALAERRTLPGQEGGS